MPVIILAHRAEFYCGTDEDNIRLYTERRNAEQRELTTMAREIGLPPFPAAPISPPVSFRKNMDGD